MNLCRAASEAVPARVQPTWTQVGQARKEGSGTPVCTMPAPEPQEPPVPPQVTAPLRTAHQAACPFKLLTSAIPGLGC